MRRELSLRSRLLALLALFALFATFAGLLGLVAAGPAAALVMASGDNGDVKIHAANTAESDQRDDTHVCLFYLDAFDFGGLRQVAWRKSEQSPTGRSQVSSGHIALDSTGHGRTADMSLPPGDYEVTWTSTGEHGRTTKSKAFRSDCHGTAVADPSGNHSDQSSAGSSSGSPSAPGGHQTNWLGIALVLVVGSALLRRKPQ